MPASHQLNIAASQAMTQVVLYNTHGQTVRRESARGLSHQLNIAGLSPGIYILEVTTPNNLQRQKITIQ
ncbi:T9SS type A sorting domain-containing protein [Geofilum rubicundum]|uniref:T9SS type A sorting domain-containing protein n=1 Tax=Geofilum rubicundum TaxID=472113 RepID=UPI0012F7F98F|nr:T9SS type A sorting domain-containing protein [Geofilum rubicundum]